MSRQPAEMTSTPGPQADRGRRSQGFRLRERAAYPQLCGFHLISEGDGPRHASYGTVPPSNLGRPLLACPEPQNQPIIRTNAAMDGTSIVRPPGERRQVALGVGVAAFFNIDLADRAPDNAN